LFSPLPVRDPDRFVVVACHDTKDQDPHEISQLGFKDLEAQNNVLSDMTAYLIQFGGLSADHRSERVLVTYVEGNYFTSLGIQPLLGRVFLPSESQTPGISESLLISVFGGLGGAALGLYLMRWIEAIRLPGDFPLRTDLPFDWRMFAYVASIAIAAGLLAGLVPAWRASRVDLNETLRESGRSLTGAPARLEFETRW